jgi:LPS-assembly protein
MGGELSLNANLTSLSRQTAQFDLINQSIVTNSPINTNPCALANLSDPATAAKIVSYTNSSNCLLRGIKGTYTRTSAEVRWQRSFTDSVGQVFTPFMTARGDAASISVANAPGLSNFGFNPGDSAEFRVMPAVGVVYRYPFINVQSWGTQTVEPIAQIVLRPNEMRIGKFPNEDAQSLVFDDSNLFSINKFSGWDRIEGGGRLNVGVQYTAQFNRAGFLNAVFGQSYQLFGTNSFAVGDMMNTGLGSGLDKTRSDYVARLSFRPDSVYTFSTRYRFDESTLALRRFEAETQVKVERWMLLVLYGHYAAQPALGFMDVRDGVMTQASYRIATNWQLSVAARYDLHAKKVVSTLFGVGYVDDCIILGVNYFTNYIYSGNVSANHGVMLQLALRTIGGNTTAQGLDARPF